MSTNIDMLNPDFNSVNSLVVGLGSQQNNQNQGLLSEDELDELINSQLSKQEAQLNPAPQEPIQVEQEQEEIHEQISIPEEIKTKVEAPVMPELPPLEENQEEEDLPPKEEKKFDYDLNTMNTNLDTVRTDTLSRLDKLKTNQNLLYNKIELLEKFNLIDERELAIQTVKKEQNLQRIGQIQGALSRRMELITAVLDVALKYEDMILKWYKTLMEVERDKVSAYQKIKMLNKATTAGESDINKALDEVNKIIAGDSKHLVEAAKNELSVSGYGGKKFNQ